MALLIGSLAGILCAFAWRPLTERLPAGIPERLTQPGRFAGRVGIPTLAAVGASVGACVGLRTGWQPALAASLWLVMLLVPIVVIDVQHRVIPDLLTVPGAAVGYVLAVWAAPARAEELAVAALLGAFVVAAVAIADPEGLGMGDAKLVLLLGAVLGSGLLLVVVVCGAALAVPVLAAVWRHGRDGLAATVPLAPFLALGAVATVLVLR